MSRSQFYVWLLLLGLVVLPTRTSAALQDTCPDDEPQEEDPKDKDPPDNPPEDPDKDKKDPPTDPDDGCEDDPPEDEKKPEPPPTPEDEDDKPPPPEPEPTPDEDEKPKPKPKPSPPEDEDDNKPNPKPDNNCGNKHDACEHNTDVCPVDAYSIMTMVQCASSCERCEDTKHMPDSKDPCKDTTLKCFKHSIRDKCEGDPKLAKECPYSCGPCGKKVRAALGITLQTGRNMKGKRPNFASKHPKSKRRRAY